MRKMRGLDFALHFRLRFILICFAGERRFIKSGFFFGPLHMFFDSFEDLELGFGGESHMPHVGSKHFEGKHSGKLRRA